MASPPAPSPRVARPAQLYRRAAAADARPLLERAVDVLDQTAGPNKVTLLAMLDLAATNLEMGHTDDAIAGFDDALARLNVAEQNQKHGREALRGARRLPLPNGRGVPSVGSLRMRSSDCALRSLCSRRSKDRRPPSRRAQSSRVSLALRPDRGKRGYKRAQGLPLQPARAPKAAGGVEAVSRRLCAAVCVGSERPSASGAAPSRSGMLGVGSRPRDRRPDGTPRGGSRRQRHTRQTPSGRKRTPEPFAWSCDLRVLSPLLSPRCAVSAGTHRRTAPVRELRLRGGPAGAHRQATSDCAPFALFAFSSVYFAFCYLGFSPRSRDRPRRRARWRYIRIAILQCNQGLWRKLFAGYERLLVIA